MRLLRPLVLLGCAFILTGQVRVENGHSEGSISLMTDHGPIKADLQEFDIDLSQPNRSADLLSLFVIREPHSGLAYWTVWARNPLDSSNKISHFNQGSIFYHTEKEIIEFSTSAQTLAIRVLHDKADNAESEKDRAIASISERLRHPNGYGPLYPMHGVDLMSVGRDFFYLKGSAAGAAAKVTNVTRSDHIWRVNLKGPNGDAITVKLDERYKLMGIDK